MTKDTDAVSVSLVIEDVGMITPSDIASMTDAISTEFMSAEGAAESLLDAVSLNTVVADPVGPLSIGETASVATKPTALIEVSVDAWESLSDKTDVPVLVSDTDKEAGRLTCAEMAIASDGEVDSVKDGTTAEAITVSVALVLSTAGFDADAESESTTDEPSGTFSAADPSIELESVTVSENCIPRIIASALATEFDVVRAVSAFTVSTLETVSERTTANVQESETETGTLGSLAIKYLPLLSVRRFPALSVR